MRNAIGILKKLFPTTGKTILAGLIGISASLCIYLVTMQRHFFSKRYVLYALAIAGVGMILAGWLNDRLLKGRVSLLPKRMKVSAIIFSLLMGMIVLANTKIQPLYYLLPDTKLELRIPIGEVPQGQESVRLLWVETGQGTVHYANLKIEGEWERVEKNIVFAPNQEVKVSWQGKVGSQPEVAFRLTSYDQSVYVAWNGDWHEYNLYNAQIDPDEPNLLIREKVKVPLACRLPFMLSFTIVIGYLIFIALIFLGTWHPAKRARVGKKYGWLKYMLPMLICWGFTLLVFWPGIMTNDSVAMWEQTLDGQYSDWQSAFYSILLTGLVHIWYSPAVVSVMQVVLFSFLVAWGLGVLHNEGTPEIILWLISLLFATLPFNNLYSVTLWRDIPYAIAVLWLVILLLKLFLSKGEWAKSGWVWLALAGFLIAILRKNGIPAAFGALALLPLFYRKFWKPLTGSLVLCLVLFAVIKGPIYSLFHVDRSQTGQSNLILLHHIAAHLNAGTELKPEEKTYLDSFMPTSDWFYYCCYVGTISYDNNFAREKFLTSGAETRQLALDLFLRDPAVDIQHTTCSGELVWRYNNNQCYMKSTHGFNSWIPGRVSWILENKAGLKEDSKLPGLVQPYVDSLRLFGFRDDFMAVYLRPALYLYLALFCIAVIVLRFNDGRAALISLPILIQSVVLFLISYAPAIRYQYGTCLAGLFLIGLLFLPAENFRNIESDL